MGLNHMNPKLQASGRKGGSKTGPTKARPLDPQRAADMEFMSENVKMSAGHLASIHPEGVRCPICTKPGQLFATVHVKGPPCLKCRAIMVTSGPLGYTYWHCPKCGANRDQEYER